MEHHWSGTFTTTDYTTLSWPLVHGLITLKLPDNIEDVKDEKASLQYKGWYRSGQVSEFNFTYNKQDSNGIGEQLGVVESLKGFNILTKQTIDFLIDEKTGGKISGTYQSFNPDDKGVFTITKNINVI